MKISLKIVAMSTISMLSLGVSSQNVKTASSLFKNGDFTGSQKMYHEVLSTNPNDLKSLIYMGYTSLLFNQLEESEMWFNKVKEIKPRLPTLNYFVSEIYHRQNQYSKASTFYRACGREAMAKKMEYYANIRPYKMDESFDEISIKFVITDPLPVIEITINNVYKGYFFLDTGAGDVILTNDFANKIKVHSFGVEKGGGFGGGKKASIGHGSVSSLTIGNLVIENVPIITLDLNNLELGGYKIDGTIGTVFLYQFLSTIDYKNGQLILRNKTKCSINDIALKSQSPKIIPFVMADDHFMMVKGNINNNDTMLLFVDTGLEGNAFTCPKSTFKKLGLSYNKHLKNKAIGGGGYYITYPMEIDKICLGDICETKLHGQYGAFPTQIEKSFGFNVNGLISHEFFRKYSLTIDFIEMKYLISD
jgi:hypothetical protein